MEIRQALITDKDKVLKILDEFSDFANSLEKDWDGQLSTYSRDHSGEMFDQIIKTGLSVIFIAIDHEEAVGFLELHKVPRLRKANYYGEIEGMFVREEFRGQGIAKLLMQQALNYAKQEKLNCLRLYSGHELKRAHAFYEKMGFIHAGRTYKISDYN
jgi:PhnO protein